MGEGGKKKKTARRKVAPEKGKDAWSEKADKRGTHRREKDSAKKKYAPPPSPQDEEEVEVEKELPRRERAALKVETTIDRTAVRSGGETPIWKVTDEAPRRNTGLPVKIRNAYTWVFLFAAMAVFLVIWEVEIVTREIVKMGFTQSAVSGFEMNGQNIDGRVQNTELQKLLKVGLLVCVTIQTGLYLRYHRLLTEYDTQRKGAREMHQERWSRRIGLAFDVVLGMLHIPFFWDWSFEWDTFRSYSEGDMPWRYDAPTGTYAVPYHIDMASMFLVLPFNVALIPRLVLYHSELWTEGAALARVAKVEVSVGVAIRAGFTRSPGRYLFFLLAFPFVTCSIIFSNCERIVTPMYGSQHHAAWASYISLTTVGYGTDEAQTQCGRSVSMVLIILGIMGTSMLISKVESAMHMDRSQQTVMRMISEQERAASVRTLSAIVIQKVWRAYHPGKHGHANARGEKKAFEAMVQAFRELARVRKAPLEFDADFETRMEQQVWDLQEQVTELKDRLREEQEQTRLQVLQNLAKMQGVMLKTVLHEIRDSSHGAEDDHRAPTSGRAGGDRGSETRTSGHNGSGKAFAALAAVKKTKQRSRRLSRD